MLDFFFNDELDGFAGHISMQDAQWLVKMGVAEQAHLPYDDFEVSAEQVKERYQHYKVRAEQLNQTPGFMSYSLETYGEILRAAKDRNCGVRAVSD